MTLKELVDMDEITDPPDQSKRYSDRAKEILDRLEEFAYAKALLVPLVEGARLQAPQGAIHREATRRNMKSKTSLEGKKLFVRCEKTY
jgi:hypothetical protein